MCLLPFKLHLMLFLVKILKPKLTGNNLFKILNPLLQTDFINSNQVWDFWIILDLTVTSKYMVSIVSTRPKYHNQHLSNSKKIKKLLTLLFKLIVKILTFSLLIAKDIYWKNTYDPDTTLNKYEYDNCILV